MSSTALYLYCIVPASDPLPALVAPALDGGPVHAVRHQELAALAHACPPEPYQGSEEQVRGWIAAHNAVVEEAWESADSVLPMSFDVIVGGDAVRSAEANLIGWLTEHHAALRGRLRALEGRAEVGVQVLWNLETLAGAPAADAPGRRRGRAGMRSSPSSSTGGNYGTHVSGKPMRTAAATSGTWPRSPTMCRLTSPGR